MNEKMISNGDYDLEKWEGVEKYAVHNPTEFYSFLILSRSGSLDDPKTFQPIEIIDCELFDQVPTMDALLNHMVHNTIAVSCGDCGEVLCGAW